MRKSFVLWAAAMAVFGATALASPQAGALTIGPLASPSTATSEPNLTQHVAWWCAPRLTVQAAWLR